MNRGEIITVALLQILKGKDKRVTVLLEASATGWGIFPSVVISL